MTTIDGETQAYPFGPTNRLDVDPRLARVRAETPVLRVRLAYGGDASLLTRFADVRTVLADPRFSHAAAATAGQDVPRATSSTPSARP
jgi:hypothetical protein